MKKYSKTQLKEKAKDIFKSYPDATTLHATSDGQFFLEQNRAQLHADENELQVIEIEKNWDTSTGSAQGTSASSVQGTSTGSATSSVTGDAEDEHHISVEELQEKVKACTDVAALKKWLQQEQKAEKPRKTAVACLEKRLKELETEKK